MFPWRLRPHCAGPATAPAPVPPAVAPAPPAWPTTARPTYRRSLLQPPRLQPGAVLSAPAPPAPLGPALGSSSPSPRDHGSASAMSLPARAPHQWWWWCATGLATTGLEVFPCAGEHGTAFRCTWLAGDGTSSPLRSHLRAYLVGPTSILRYSAFGDGRFCWQGNRGGRRPRRVLQ